VCDDAAPLKEYLEILEVAGVHRKKQEHNTRLGMIGIGRMWVGWMWVAQMPIGPE